MKQFKKLLKNKKFLIGLGVVVFFFIASRAAFEANYESFVAVIRDQGLKGKLIYIVYTILSVVILTLPIIPVWPIIHSAFGLNQAIMLTYIGIVLGGMVNFFIARRYGKPIVEKLVGKKAYEEVENLIELSDVRIFLLLRLLVNNFYDSISYLAGFSDVGVRMYTLVTVSASFVWVLVYFYGIEYSSTIDGTMKFLVMGIGYVSLAAVGLFIFKKLKEQNDQKKIQRDAELREKVAE